MKIVKRPVFLQSKETAVETAAAAQETNPSVCFKDMQKKVEEEIHLQ